VIEVSALRMSYAGFEAIRGIDLHVARGEIFAFLDPNGSSRPKAPERACGSMAPWVAVTTRWPSSLSTGHTRSTAQRWDPLTLALVTNLFTQRGERALAIGLQSGSERLGLFQELALTPG
jgi:ABC-type hemin transport system ATPase subunit